MGNALKLAGVLLLLAGTWMPVIRKCYNTEGLVLPPLSISMDSYPTLPSEFVGKGEGKSRSLYHDYNIVHGYSYVPREQGFAPSCVGQSMACAVDILGAVEVLSGHRGVPPPRSSASWFYGASRELGEINNRGGGSYCRLAARAAHELGIVYEYDYPFIGIDLTGDNPQRDISFGKHVPEEIKQFTLAKITSYYKLRSYEDVRDAIYAGMPVVVGSNVGFGNGDQVRDNQGFLTRPWLAVRGRYWNHAMTFVAVSDVGREGVLCQNSWGNWVSGPQRYGDEPLGSFWIDASVVQTMVSRGDTFAIQGLR